MGAEGLTGEPLEIWGSPDVPSLPLLQIETKVEPNEVHNPVPLIVGSSVGGLVLLALITAGLYKVSPLPVCSPLSSLLLTQQLIIGFNSHQVTESQFLQL